MSIKQREDYLELFEEKKSLFIREFTEKTPIDFFKSPDKAYRYRAEFGLLKKKDELQTKLVTFREKYKLIKPTEEGFTIKDQQNQIENQLIALYAERNRLEDVKDEIERGSLTARGFKKEMNDGLSISDFDQGLLQQLINVENELASARSKYTDNSSIIRGLNLRLKQIQPVLLKNQLEAVDTSLKLNQGSINSTKNLQKELEKISLIQLMK